MDSTLLNLASEGTTGFIYVFRMLLAIICGMIIGWERKNRSKGAGVRTHCVVACGSALIMLVSKYGFSDVYGADPSRIASTIVSGIGFLGAGMIMVQRQTVVGLTTAAGIWATSGIGMAIGSGLYLVGFAATLLILLIHLLLHNRITNTQVTVIRLLTIYGVDEEGFQKKLETLLKEKDIHINDVSIHKTKELVWKYQLEVEIPNEISEEEVANWFDYEVSLEMTD